MNRCRILLSLLVVISQPSFLLSDETGLRAPEGFEVSLYAGDDLAHDIYSMTIDSHGRVVVAGAGYVKILQDDNADGRADRAMLFSSVPASGADDAAAWRGRLAKVSWDKGDAQRGRMVFEKRACHRCHAGSGPLGPDLAGVASRFSRDDLFAHIIDPNKEVSPLYQTTQVVTGSGRIVVGLIVYESPESTLVQTGPDTTVRVAGEDCLHDQEQSIIDAGRLVERGRYGRIGRHVRLPANFGKQVTESSDELTRTAFFAAMTRHSEHRLVYRGNP